MASYGTVADLPETSSLLEKGGNAGGKGQTKLYPPLDHDLETGDYVDYSTPKYDAKESIRLGFIRKVYGILSFQLLMSTAFVFCTIYVESVKNFVQTHPSLLTVAMFASFVLVLMLTCFDSVSKRHPTNIIVLFLFTAVESYLLAFISSVYETQIVVQAMIMTAAIVVGLTIYAMTTSTDFTGLGPVLFTFLCCMLVGGLIRLWLPHSAMADTLWGCLGAFLFSLYIIYDTQLLISKMQPDEYIYCAISLYLDIINLFIHILQILGSSRD